MDMTRKYILLVENDPNLRQSIALILGRAGYLVRTTDCFSNISSLLPTGEYYLLIADVNVPETQIEKLHTASNQYPQLPLLVLTDRSLLEIEEEANQLQASYLVKPIDPSGLLNSIRSIVGSTNHSDPDNKPL